MEKHGNKTIMCSVLFLDIVEYSKRSVGGQISLKERFNSYLSNAISSVPIADRIILDTGDGAAINFLGDIEDALKAAISLRESILNEDPHIAPPLLVRMGINHGPVRLVRDINGQPNIVGDGINVAQRVMSFADAGQILVSRSYFDAVSRLSPTSAGLFHYQGSRTDKHVREHEVYATGYPGDKVSQLALTNEPSEHLAAAPWYVKFGLPFAAAGLGAAAKDLVDQFKRADPRKRALYASALAISLVLMVALILKLAHHGEAPALPGQVKAGSAPALNGIQPISAVASVVTAVPQAESKKTNAGSTKAAAKPDIKMAAEGRPGLMKSVESKTGGTQSVAHTDMIINHAARDSDGEIIASKTDNKKVVDLSVSPAMLNAYISLICKEGAKLFVDGAEKGRVVSTKLTVTVPPGKHEIIVTSQNGSLYTQNVDVDLGKTINISPAFCK